MCDICVHTHKFSCLYFVEFQQFMLAVLWVWLTDLLSVCKSDIGLYFMDEESHYYYRWVCLETRWKACRIGDECQL